MHDGLEVSRELRDQRIFVTGATGFLGKVIVEKLLWSVPTVGKLMLLVRPAAGRGAGERLRDEVLGSPAMARLRVRHGSDWPAWAADRVEVVAGDIGRDRFGLDRAAWSDLCRRVDGVVASAATVAFDERLDRAVELNAQGALRALDLARNAGGVPLVHLSTCFVSGRRRGWVSEEPAVADGARDPREILAELEETCRNVHPGSAGAPDAAALAAAGAFAAHRLGFHDVYTLTKALAEQLLAAERGSVPVAIVRPAIVESALAEPIPGWIEAVRVVDPLLVAYGRGRTRVLPGAPDLPLELVPVDLVANATIAALADLRHRHDGRGRDLPVYQVGSSRHPVELGEIVASAREGFARTPLRDARDEPIAVGEARFASPDRLHRELDTKRRRLRHLAGALSRVGITRFTRRLTIADRTLEHFIRLVEIYRPYLTEGARYEDRATRALWDRLSPDSRASFPFDVTAIDWRSYLARTHVPGLIRFALRAESGSPPPEGEEGPPAERLAEAVALAAEARSLSELFTGVALAHPDRIAFQTFRDGRWLRYTYAESSIAGVDVARRLSVEHGIGRGDRVVLWASGSPEWALATLAVHSLGAATVPLDPQWPAAEVAAAAHLVGAKLVCADPRIAGPSRDALATALEPDGVGVVELGAHLVPEPGVAARPGPPEPGAAGRAAPDDLASILFTSGTTVSPKAVPLTHANYLANVRDLVPVMRLTRERLLSVLPVHHAFEQTVGLYVPMAGASTVSYLAEMRPEEIRWMMATTRPTVLVAVPRLLELLHAGITANVKAGGLALAALFRVLSALSDATGGRFGHLLFAKVHRRFGGSLRRIATGGSALRPELGRSFRRMGFRVAEGYGMTETAPVLTVNPWDAIRFGSVGRPLPGVEIELRDPAGATTVPAVGGAHPERSEGEIWVRGANVMAGYWRNPEATAEVMADGWLDTGDLGSFDEDGYLRISGRTKEVIVTAAGKNVYPEEVEARYRGLPAVEDLVVLGLPAGDGGSGERVTAVVVPSPGTTPEGIEGIRAAITARSAEVPSYQQVARVEIWRGELPKTTTLKVKRGRLRDALLAGKRANGAAPSAPSTPSSPTRAAAAPELARGEAETWAVSTLSRLTSARADHIRPSDRLAELGVDSLTRVELVGALEARTGRRLDDAVVAALGSVQDLLDLA